MKKLLILFFAAVVYLQAFAVPADPKPVTVTQPNGEEITLMMNGDEYIHWAETMDGYTLLINSEFYFCYAQRNASGDLEPSPYIATEIENRPHEVSAWLQNINKNLFYSEEQVYYYMQLREINEREMEQTRTGTTGVNKIPILLMQFLDRPFKKTVEDFDMLFNQINYYTNGLSGSFRDFFFESSYNKLDVQSTIFGPFTLEQNAIYYVPDGMWHQFAKHSINKALDEGIDFSDFTVNGNQIEGIYIIYAGYDQSAGCKTCIWAHAQLSFNFNQGGYLFKRYAASSELEGTNGAVLSTIGTFCHEYGHVLGARDFYDTNYETWGQYDGTGYWDLQASGSYNDDGKKPATPNPRSKITSYGWATAIELNTPQRCTIPVGRIYDNAYYRINTPKSNEYFLLENKKKEGFDTKVPGENLLIYRCTENYEGSGGVSNYPGNTTSWQRFYPVAANAKDKVPEFGTNKQSQYGSINSFSCTWPQTNNTEFTNTSTPAMVTLDGASVNAPITNITVHDDFITFDYIGGGSGTKSNYHVFLPAYYGCTIIPQSGSSSPVNAGGNFSFKIDLLSTHNKSNLVVTANHSPIVPFGGIYTISNIQADQIVRIEGLKFNTFTISASTTGKGSITPSGEVQVTQNGIQTFEIRPENGYSIDYVTIDGVNKGKIESYTFKKVNEPHTISATFKRGDLYHINTSIKEAYFESRTNVPSESVVTIVSSPDVIANITVSAPKKFEVSKNGKQWYKSFIITKGELPYNLHIRFFPPFGYWNIGFFTDTLTFKSTDAYSEIILRGKAEAGIDENDNGNTIKVYPNPTTGHFIIENGELRIENVYVFDIYGRKVFEHKTESGKQNEIDITNLSAGIYLLEINTDKGIVHKKVVKE